MNGWSARDVQFAEMQVHVGPTKGKDTATTLRPFLVTPDDLEPHRHGNAFDLQMTARVNGEIVGTDRWLNMSFSYAQMLTYASRGTEIRTGDVLGSGTCGGGCLAERWGRNGLESIPPLQPGDTVSIEVEGLGAQVTRIVEQRFPPLDPTVLAARRRA